jgi:hypothetical protein
MCVERGQLLIDIWTGLYNLLFNQITEYETEIEVVKNGNEQLMEGLTKKKDADIALLELALQNVRQSPARQQIC